MRLPGDIYMRPGRSSHETQYDLSGLSEDVLSLGCLVRIRSRVFRVEAIGPRKLTFDRKVGMGGGWVVGSGGGWVVGGG